VVPAYLGDVVEGDLARDLARELIVDVLEHGDELGVSTDIF
jgi:hypothetical protein